MRIRFVVGSLIALVAVAPSLGETPLGTGFTFQGQLKEAGVPLEGTADFQFTLWDAAGSGNPPTGGTQVGGVQAINALPVTSGFFTVTLNTGGEFGGNAFNGDGRWLQISINGTPLSPRQRLSPTPYALQTRGIFVDDSGRVGVGTTAPLEKVDIFAPGRGGLRMNGNGTGDTFFSLFNLGPTHYLFDNQSGGHALTLESGQNTDIVFNTSGRIERARITAAGRLGIGDSTPNATLTVGNGDKFQVAGAEGDVTFTDDLASINFPASAVPNAPMITMFASGTENANRMALAHSPTFSNWGLQYQDTTGNAFHFLRSGASVMTVDLENSAVGIGTSTPTAKLDVAGTARVDVLEIDGGADLSENFVVAGGAEPGMVLAIDPDHPGALCIARRAYDKRVAGIVSGAGGIKSGMVMGQSGSLADGGHHVALTGRVYCWCDASEGGIEPGDLLTTSDTPGHAMRVSDEGRSAGAILGKAMTSLTTGRGLVLVLVSLQ